MKKFILSLLALVICGVANVSARTFALVTGVSNYEGTVNDLHQTTKDAKRFKEVLETQTKDITLLTSKYVTKSNVLEKLRAICNRAQKGDRIVFFYSGHGSPGAVCGYDQAIPYDEIISILRKSEASEKFCFIDACFAGTMGDNLTSKSWTKTVKDENNMAFFVSCRSNELSAEHPFVGAGYFTQSLINGMRGKSDKDGNKEINVKELFTYIHKDVVKRTGDGQHPQLITSPAMLESVVTKWK